MRSRSFFPLSFALLSVAHPAWLSGVAPLQNEITQRQQWLRPRLTTAPLENRPSLTIVQEDVADGVSRGRSWRGTPFQIAGQSYQHGIAFNASKAIRVHLDRPAVRFTVDVGLENNDDTRRGAEQGKGSVSFHVWAGGREIAASPILRLRDPAYRMNVALNGATQFEIRVGDGGDGRGWDQALWGHAEVHYQDGSLQRLQDFPWLDELDSSLGFVSFKLAGRPSSELLGQWTRETQPDSNANTQEVQLHDPDTRLELRVSIKTFDDSSAVEWVARLKNNASNDSPMIEDLCALDSTFALMAAGSPTLHWAKGAVASLDDFAPQTTILKSGSSLRLHPGGGRSSSQVMPFFNLEGAGAGVVLAIGWSGEWAASFEPNKRGAVRVRTGLDRTRFILRPGEEIRTPSMLALFYEGDRWRGQNLLRRHLLTQHRPQIHGRPLVAPITCGNWGGTSAEVHLDNIRTIIRERLPIDYYWIDAEWYGNVQGDTSWPVNVGRWTVKTNLYPHGFKPLSDALRQSGRELMLWFEPERVFKGTPWHVQHPHWLLDTGGSSLLFNLANPDAVQFLTDFISDRIQEFGLGCYRQDFNIDPLTFWRKADAPDRQGMTEIRYIEGLYAFWDGLRSRHPNLIIDNCASGGRRLDLETVGRATPFWRTDGPRDPIAHQCHTFGLLPWVPLSATSQDRPGDDYEFRSSMCSSLCLNWWVSGDAPAGPIRPDFPFEWARRTLAQYLDIRPFYYGDFYPLTSYSQAPDVWMAYQLDRDDLGSGLIVALRRPQSPYDAARLVLHGLQPESVYQIQNLDTQSGVRLTGSDLLTQGLPVAIPQTSGSALLTYTKVK